MEVLAKFPCDTMMFEELAGTYGKQCWYYLSFPFPFDFFVLVVKLAPDFEMG